MRMRYMWGVLFYTRRLFREVNLSLFASIDHITYLRIISDNNIMATMCRRIAVVINFRLMLVSS